MIIVTPEINNAHMQMAARASRGVDFLGAESLDVAADAVLRGEADAMIAGIDNTTRDVILACKKHLPLKSQFFSSCFVCKRGDKTFFLADGGVNKVPNAEQFLSIVEDTAKTFIAYTGKQPRIAMLSYSTFGSGGKNAELEKIQYVIEAIRKDHPGYIIDGEMQFDVAVSPRVAKKKAPNSLIQGDANILIVPDLNTGNILYKALEQFGGFTVAGPIIQGFDKALADLSRGSTVADIKLTSDVLKKICK